MRDFRPRLKNGLKQMYKKQINEGKISSRGGAGLGLIDIARKSGQKLKYQFLDLNNNYYFFILEIEVDANSPLEAAKSVDEMMKDSSIDWQFYVQEDEDGKVWSVDLSESDDEAPLEIDKYDPLITSVKS